MLYLFIIYMTVYRALNNTYNVFYLFNIVCIMYLNIINLIIINCDNWP